MRFYENPNSYTIKYMYELCIMEWRFILFLSIYTLVKFLLTLIFHDFNIILGYLNPCWHRLLFLSLLGCNTQYFGKTTKKKNENANVYYTTLAELFGELLKERPAKFRRRGGMSLTWLISTCRNWISCFYCFRCPPVLLGKERSIQGFNYNRW